MASQNQVTQSAKVASNLRATATNARAATFAIAGMGGPLGTAVNASALIAENIARASSNAKVAAGASGIGAVVAIIGTIAAATMLWKQETVEVANKIRDIRNETARLEAQAKGNTRLERELEIQGAMDGELDAARRWSTSTGNFRSCRMLSAARLPRRAMLSAPTPSGISTANSRRSDRQHSTRLLRPCPGQRETRQIRELSCSAQRQQDAQRVSTKRRSRRVYNGSSSTTSTSNIDEEFNSGMRDLEYDLDAPARQLGDSLGRSIIGGISDGISAALHGGIGSGLKALTGSILIGFGEMMQEIGTQSLLAAQLLKKVIDAFRASPRREPSRPRSS
jgi:hypothetical protein